MHQARWHIDFTTSDGTTRRESLTADMSHLACRQARHVLILRRFRITDVHGIYINDNGETAQLVGFSDDDKVRVDDYLITHLAQQRINSPTKPLDDDSVWRMILPYKNNPWLTIPPSFVIMVGGLVALVAGATAIDGLASVLVGLFGGATALLGGWVFVWSVGRIKWWRDVRSAAREIAGRIPEDLAVF